MYLSSIFHRKTNGNFSIEKSYFSLPAIVCVCCFQQLWPYLDNYAMSSLITGCSSRALCWIPWCAQAILSFFFLSFFLSLFRIFHLLKQMEVQRENCDDWTCKERRKIEATWLSLLHCMTRSSFSSPTPVFIHTHRQYKLTVERFWHGRTSWKGEALNDMGAGHFDFQPISTGDPNAHGMHRRRSVGPALYTAQTELVTLSRLLQNKAKQSIWNPAAQACHMIVFFLNGTKSCILQCTQLLLGFSSFLLSIDCTPIIGFCYTSWLAKEVVVIGLALTLHKLASRL